MFFHVRTRIILLIVSISRALRGELSTRKLVKMGLQVGKRFDRQGGVRIDASHCYLISIGDDVTLAPNVHILAHDTSLKRHLGVSRIAKVYIGNNVFIGAGSIILPGVKIADNTIVGAGSVVTKSVERSGVYAGNPARLVITIEDYIARERKKFGERPILSATKFLIKKDVSFLRKTVDDDYAYSVSQHLNELGLPEEVVADVASKQII